MACTSDIETLELYDVHSISETNSNFELEGANDLLHACNENGPLSFCLLPPQQRLKTMCTSTLNAYFQNVIDGKAALTLLDLPLVYDMALYYDNDNNVSWIPEAKNENDIVGLTSLPLFVSMAVSNDCNLLLGVIDGQLFKTDSKLGMVVKVKNVLGTNDLYQKVTVNELGNVGIVLFSNRIFLWNLNVFTLQNLEGDNFNFIDVTLFSDNSVFLIGRNTNLCRVWNLQIQGNNTKVNIVTYRDIPLNESSDIFWSCQTMDRLHTLVAIYDSQSPSEYTVFAFNNTLAKTAQAEFIWTVSRNGIGGLGKWSCVCRGNVNSETISVFAIHRQSAMGSKLTFSTNVVTSATNIGLNTNLWEVVENINRTVIGFKTIQNQDVAVQQDVSASGIITLVSSTGLDLSDTNSVLFFEPSGNRAWILGGNTRKLFTASASFDAVTTIWQTSSLLSLNENIQISDFGKQTGTFVPPAETITWYFGRVLKNNGFIQSYDEKYVVTSPHQTFRLVIDNVIAKTQTSFDVAKIHFEKANIDIMMKQPGAVLRFYDNANVEIFVNGKLIWQRNMNDSFSSNDIYVESTILPLLPLASKNGLYLLFCAESRGRPRLLNVVFNVYNSAAFSEFCKNAVTLETFSRAIQRQSTFCKNNLVNPDLTAGPQDMFSDARCTCISSQEVFGRFFPHLQSDTTHPSHARLQQNLPCLLSSCQEAIATKEITNVYNTMQKKCNQSMITLCSTVLAKNSSAKVNLETNGIITQVCGANLARCTQDSQCGIGTYCVNGVCTRGCDIDTDCKFPSVCQNGVCVYLNARAINTSQPILAIIILSVIVALALIALFLVFFLPNRKKTKL